jgi:hypothetical protein
MHNKAGFQMPTFIPQLCCVSLFFFKKQCSFEDRIEQCCQYCSILTVMCSKAGLRGGRAGRSLRAPFFLWKLCTYFGLLPLIQNIRRVCVKYRYVHRHFHSIKYETLFESH